MVQTWTRRCCLLAILLPVLGPVVGNSCATRSPSPGPIAEVSTAHAAGVSAAGLAAVADIADAPATLPSAPAARDAPRGPQEDLTLEGLLALEEKVGRVLETAMPCVVAVTKRGTHGSGVIVSPDGLILTAAHVVGGAGHHLRVILADGTRVSAKSLGVNQHMDSAMLKITDAPPKETGEWPYAQLSPPALPQDGQWCVALGHSGGFDKERPAPVRVGRILGYSGSWLRTDCTITYGDSGGPLFDMEGRVLAIHSRVHKDFSNNYHVPVRTYRQSWERLKLGEEWGTGPAWKRPSLGVDYDRTSVGCVIGKVTIGSAADRAGIRRGDRAIAFNGEPISRSTDLEDLISDHKPGDRVTLKVRRGAQTFDLKPVLTTSPDRGRRRSRRGTEDVEAK